MVEAMEGDQTLELNNKFFQTLQQAYLEYFQYYHENNQLKKYNAKLK